MKIETNQGEKKYVFISYAHADEEKVKPILRQLSFQGLRFWYDGGIHSESWRERLAEEITTCQKMIVMLSQNYMNSRECRRELELADVNRKEYVVIRLDNAKLIGTCSYILSGLQYKNASKLPVRELVEELMNEDWAIKCSDYRESVPILEPEFSNDPCRRYWNGLYTGDQKEQPLWGPKRKVYENGERPPFAVLNSERSERFGNELQFLEIREQGAKTYIREIFLEPGKIYEVRFLFHNNASDESNHTGLGVATALCAAVQLPLVVLPGRDALLKAGLRASLIQPGETMPEDQSMIPHRLVSVWSSVRLYVKDKPVFLEYEDTSARLETGGNANGSSLSTRLFSDFGVFLGYNKLSGVLPGGEEYAGYVHFRFKTYTPKA